MAESDTNLNRVCIMSFELLGSIPLAFLIFGKSVLDWKLCSSGNKPCDDLGFLNIFLAVPFCLFYIQVFFWFDNEGHLRSWFCNNGNTVHRKKTYFTTFIFFVMMCGGITITHHIGSFLLSYILNKDEMWTWRSFMAGMIFNYIIMAFFLLWWLVYKLVSCFHDLRHDQPIDIQSADVNLENFDDLEDPDYAETSYYPESVAEQITYLEY
jgi:hypothetical protein